LLDGDRANCVGSGSVSGLKSTQFGHTAIVGARAVPALRAFVTTLRSYTASSSRRGSPRSKPDTNRSRRPRATQRS
jgi:hypothetical protein